MPGLISEPQKSDERQFTTSTSSHGDLQKSQGQAHDRIAGKASNSPAVTPHVENEKSMETEITAVQKMLSAVSGSLLTSLLVTPLDVVRVRLQSQPFVPKPNDLLSNAPISKFANLSQNLGVTACCREVFWVNNNSQFCMALPNAVSPNSTFTALNRALPSSSMEPAPDCAIDASRQKTFTSTLDGLQKIARNEGATSLWRGLSPTLVMAIPGNVIYFTGYDWLRSNPHSIVRKYVPDDYRPLISGSIARVAAATVVSPIEMFRTRMQATTGGDAGVFADTFSGLRKMMHRDGYRSLWRGLPLTMWRDVPFSGIYWWGYESVRNRLIEVRKAVQLQSGSPRSNSRDSNNTSTFVDSFIAGATSGAFASVVTTPFDVGKTRQQVLERSRRQAGKSALAPEELSMPTFLRNIWKEEGMGGLFKGWAARCLKVAPACAIMISSYEVGKKMAGRMNERKRNMSSTE